MHLLEQYALATGVKIKKPRIYEKFFPVVPEKYVTFHPSSKPSKTYDYWQVVIELLLAPFERAGIKIIQLGQEKEKSYSGVMNLAGLTNINQVAYILRSTMLHFGADSFPTHIASGYGKKIVALYSNNFINCVKPFFGDPKDHVLIEPKRKEKPSFSFEEHPKSINSIKPECIANKILESLGFSEKVNIETIYFGTEYNNNRLECVPNTVVNPAQFNSPNIIVRMDLFHDENILHRQLEVCPCIIVTENPINPQLILAYRAKILKLIIEIKNESQIEFANFLSHNNIPFQLFTYLSGKELENIKIKYLDQDCISEIASDLKQKTGIQYTANVFYKSNKRILSNGKIYLSEFSLKNNFELNNIFEPIVDTPDFWKEVENFYIFKVDNATTIT